MILKGDGIEMSKNGLFGKLAGHSAAKAAISAARKSATGGDTRETKEEKSLAVAKNDATKPAERQPIAAAPSGLMTPEELKAMMTATIKASGISTKSANGIKLRHLIKGILDLFAEFHEVVGGEDDSWDNISFEDGEKGAGIDKEPETPEPSAHAQAPKSPAPPKQQKKSQPTQAPSQPANAPKTVIDDEVAWLLRDSGFYVAIDAAERVGIAKDTLEKWLAKANGYAGRYAQIKAQQASDDLLDTQYKKLEALVTEIYEAVDNA